MIPFMPLKQMLTSLVGEGSDYLDPARMKHGSKNPPPKPTDTIGLIRPQITWQEAQTMLAALEENEK